jgi:hypothetical protein
MAHSSWDTLYKGFSMEFVLGFQLTWWKMSCIITRNSLGNVHIETILWVAHCVHIVTILVMWNTFSAQAMFWTCIGNLPVTFDCASFVIPSVLQKMLRLKVRFVNSYLPLMFIIPLQSAHLEYAVALSSSNNRSHWSIGEQTLLNNFFGIDNFECDKFSCYTM